MSGQVEADLKPLSFLTMTYSSFASVCFACIGNPFFLLWPRLCRRTSSLRGWNFYKALPNQPKHVRVSTSCSADCLAEINPAQLTESLWNYSTLKTICMGRCHTISAKPRRTSQMFWRHDNFQRTCAFVDSFTLSGSGFFGYNANLWFFAFFKLITLPCRVRVDNVLWFRLKIGENLFSLLLIDAPQVSWYRTHRVSHFPLRSVEILGYILPLNLREKNKKNKWRMGAEEGSLIASQFLEKCGRKKPHNIADVLGCWPTLFWNYNVSTWWIITVIKMELSGESVRFLPQRRTNGSFFSLRHSEV